MNKQDQIQNAIQTALAWNQQEHDRTFAMRSQGVKYEPKYKNYSEFMVGGI